jgi:hypothetical protein
MPTEFDFIAGTEVAKFVASNKQVDYLQGPLGSGKTVALLLRAMRHAQEQKPSPIDNIRYTRWGIVRNTLPDLKRSTVKTWLELFPEHIYGRFNAAPGFMQHLIKYNDIVAEFHFMSLDKIEDVRKLRSTEFTGILFNELPFIAKEIFDEAHSRLRYPPERHGGPTWCGVLADGNAPDEDCWLAMMTGQVDLPPNLLQDEMDQYAWPPSWGFYMQPPAVLERFDPRGQLEGYDTNPKSENLRNLRAGYYEQQLLGKSRAWIESRLMNRVALVVEGAPVWPMFRREFHVAKDPLRPVQNHDVIVALDFGRVFPAALFAQEVNQRIYVQYEILGFNEPASTFAPRVQRFLTQHYPDFAVRFVGDPKGSDKGQATEQSSYDVFRSHGMPVVPAPVKQNDIATRTEAVAYILNDNPRGHNRLVVSPLCRTLIVGMAGRYHLVREDDGELRPKKDKYSNLCDALQYLCLGLGEGRRMVGLKPVGEIRPARIRGERKSMRRVFA